MAALERKVHFAGAISYLLPSYHNEFRYDVKA